MTKGVKIFLGIGCGLLVIGAIVIIGGIFALNYFEKRMSESVGPAETAGREFGQKTDNEGCMAESVKRSKSIGLLDISGAIELTAFTDACLEASRKTPNFCDGVPSFWSMQDSEWGLAQCQKAGVDPEKTGCVHVFKRKHQFCNK